MVSNRKLKNFKIMWQLISQELKEEGYIVTPLQVENKFKTLERAYDVQDAVTRCMYELQCK